MVVSTSTVIVNITANNPNIMKLIGFTSSTLFPPSSLHALVFWGKAKHHQHIEDGWSCAEIVLYTAYYGYLLLVIKKYLTFHVYIAQQSVLMVKNSVHKLRHVQHTIQPSKKKKCYSGWHLPTFHMCISHTLR